MKGKRSSFEDADCPIARALGVIGDWWSLLIVREAFAGKVRFGEFQKSLGLARNILSTRLKKLVDQGILRIEPEGAGKFHRYVLTPKGEGLGVVLVALWQWGETACFDPGELRHAIVDRAQGEPLARLELAAQDGRALGVRDYRRIATDAPP
jgi:DNA-binding HxlR family transcriptional regulator